LIPLTLVMFMEEMPSSSSRSMRLPAILQVVRGGWGKIEELQVAGDFVLIVAR
jgi:hypothetical protein